eukprot:3968192-Pyramimonas_sp.AAC.1
MGRCPHRPDPRWDSGRGKPESEGKKGRLEEEAIEPPPPRGLLCFCLVLVYFAFFGPRKVPRRHDRIRFETL